MKKGLILKISLLSASLLVASAPAINANIPAMAKAFPDIPLSMVEMLTTISSLFLMISVLTSSFIARKFGYKRTIVFGITIVGIAGILPAFINNFYIVFISRGVLGFGIGLFNSLLVSMISCFYNGDEKSSLFGIQGACEGLGGIFVTFVAGQLIKLNWQAPFFAYLIAFPVLLLFLKFVPNISVKDILDKTDQTVFDSSYQKSGSIIVVLKYVAVIFLAAICYMTMGIKVSTLMVSEGYGAASDASSVIMLLSVGSMIAGFSFGKIYKVFKEYILVVSFGIVALALFLIGISQSITMTVFGGFLIGLGFRSVMPYFINKVNNGQIANTALGTSLLLVGYNLGCAVAPYGSLILQKLSGSDSLRNLFYIDAIVFMMLALGAFVITLISHKKPNILIE